MADIQNVANGVATEVIKKKNLIARFFKSIFYFIAGIFTDIHKFLDEKKVFGFIYLVSVLVGFFTLHVSVNVLVVILEVGLILYLGIPISDAIKPLDYLPGMGLFDLITNKANQIDSSRIFGVVFLAAGIIYFFLPLFIAGYETRFDYLALISNAGLVLLGVAILGDHIATKKGV